MEKQENRKRRKQEKNNNKSCANQWKTLGVKIEEKEEDENAEFRKIQGRMRDGTERRRTESRRGGERSYLRPGI